MMNASVTKLIANRQVPNQCQLFQNLEIVKEQSDAPKKDVRKS